MITTWKENATGLLPPVSDGIRLVRRTPPPELRRDVLEIVGYQEGGGPDPLVRHFRQIQPAPLAVPWIICFGEPFRIGLGAGAELKACGGSFLAGPFAGPACIDSHGRSACIKVSFTLPGAHRFLGVPMHELAGRLVNLDSVLGTPAGDLSRRLQGEPDWTRRLELTEAFILARLRQHHAPPSPAAQAFAGIVGNYGASPVSAVASHLGWSRKHLAARFHHEIGLAPKTIARLARFNRALNLARRRQQRNWAELALECCYADQAHLIRDFKDFVGESPTAWQTRLALS